MLCVFRMEERRGVLIGDSNVSTIELDNPQLHFNRPYRSLLVQQQSNLTYQEMEAAFNQTRELREQLMPTVRVSKAYPELQFLPYNRSPLHTELFNRMCQDLNYESDIRGSTELVIVQTGNDWKKHITVNG